MKNVPNPMRFVIRAVVKKTGSRALRVKLVTAIVLGVTTFAFFPLVSPAQPDLSTRSTTTSAEPSANSTPAPSAQSSLPAIEIQTSDERSVASILSGTGFLVVMGLGLIGLLVSLRVRSRPPDQASEFTEWVEDERPDRTPGTTGNAQKGAVTNGARLGGSATHTPTYQTAVRVPVASPTSFFGAYRIDHEVGKLVLGEPYRLEVLASRASDDRRAIEASLIKSVNAANLDESCRRRAREALEAYGFVAHQCAALLLGADAFERLSAARTLGEIKSEAALPFLLESLYDSATIVRDQAVMSIGELKSPAAVGAMLDFTRTHPDIPKSLLRCTPNAPSVEGLDSIQLITRLKPSAPLEELPEGSDDEQLSSYLALLESSDADKRSEALKKLAQFRVQSAVRALAAAARNDSEANNRSIAISSLGSIDHESGFPAILIAMADDAREVRAASARALNRLSFDRADAYVRIVESSDQDTIHDVASACIQAGIVSQNLDRLAHCDQRQAYKTFSLICLLAKAEMNDPVLDAITSHPDMTVRLSAVHLLASTSQPGIIEQLRDLAARDGICEEVKTALSEAIHKLDGNGSAQAECRATSQPENELQLEPAQIETESSMES